LDDLIKRVAAKHLAKMNVEPHVQRNALAMAEELADARKSLDKAEQYSRALRSEATLDWIPDLVKRIADEHRELSKTIDESLEYLKDGDSRSASSHTLDMKSAASATPGIDAIMVPNFGSKVKDLSDKINRAVDKAEAGAPNLSGIIDSVVKDIYKLIHLFDPFLRNWDREKGQVEGLQNLWPMVTTLRATLKNLDKQYALALSGGKYHTVDLLTQIGTETAALVTAYNQIYRHLT
jgi:hypothetical protein